MSAHPRLSDGGVDVRGKEGDEHGDCGQSGKATAGGMQDPERDREFQKARREDQRPGERHEWWQHQGHRLGLSEVTEAEERECERESQHAAEPHLLSPPMTHEARTGRRSRQRMMIGVVMEEFPELDFVSGSSSSRLDFS